MAAKARTATATPTTADITAWAAVRDLVDRLGPDRAAQFAVYASGDPRWPYLLLAAARNTTVDDVVQVLRLEPGELAQVVNVALPPPAPPLPDDERTVIPDDLPSPPDSTAYGARSRLVLLREVPESQAASLASLVPGVRGIVLFAISRGDAMADVAQTLGISIGEVDAILAEGDGQHLVRPDG